MASPTKTITALVLRRTKLGETDVIVTLLAEDGSQVKAVAKGARKPTSSFASRLELYSVAKILVAEGKNLDIVKEVRLLEGNEALRNDFFRSSASAPIVELLAKSTYENQPTARLFALSRAALHSIATTPNDPLVATLAGLLKALAFLGFRPSFTECVGCGDTPELAEGTRQTFSFFDGGVVCVALFNISRDRGVSGSCWGARRSARVHERMDPSSPRNLHEIAYVPVQECIQLVYLISFAPLAQIVS